MVVKARFVINKYNPCISTIISSYTLSFAIMAALCAVTGIGDYLRLLRYIGGAVVAEVV